MLTRHRALTISTAKKRLVSRGVRSVGWPQASQLSLLVVAAISQKECARHAPAVCVRSFSFFLFSQLQRVEQMTTLKSSPFLETRTQPRTLMTLISWFILRAIQTSKLASKRESAQCFDVCFCFCCCCCFRNIPLSTTPTLYAASAAAAIATISAIVVLILGYRGREAMIERRMKRLRASGYTYVLLVFCWFCKQLLHRRSLQSGGLQV